jgi:hypothetical protein
VRITARGRKFLTNWPVGDRPGGKVPVITQTSELTHCRKSRLPVGAGVVPVMDGRTHSSEEPPAKRVAFCFGYVGLAVERLGFQPRGRLCFPQALLRALVDNRRQPFVAISLEDARFSAGRAGPDEGNRGRRTLSARRTHLIKINA